MATTLFDAPPMIHRSAEISECGKYRWWLRRDWQEWKDGQAVRGKGVCCFVMLNPSTADALQDDPTIRRCMGFAKSWGYHSLVVRNLFPWRATDPMELRGQGHLTLSGRIRGDMELLASLTADLVVVAWGAAEEMGGRDRQALDLFDRTFPAVPLYCLGTTKHGYPRHPLYVKADTQPVIFREAH